MPESSLFSGEHVIIRITNDKERSDAESMMRDAGAEDICFAENVLEMVLQALKSERALIICEKKDDVIGLADGLRYIVEHARYCTIAVIADSWSAASMEDLLGSVDVFVTRPVTSRAVMPGISVDAAKKKRMQDLEQELNRSEESFAEEKNRNFAKRVIMDTLGLSAESAGVYMSSLAERNGYDVGDAARIVYEVLLAGEKN